MRSIINRIFNFAKIIEKKINSDFSSFYCKIVLVMSNVRFEKGNKFVGRISISKLSQSTITIGSNNSFLSSTSANLLGLYHRCILSTTHPGAKLIIGDSCGFSGVSISSSNSITICNNVRCGSNCTILDQDGHDEDFRSSEPKPINIEDHVWLGSNSIIFKGVTIGRYAMIGAGSIVRTNVPPYAVTLGNPAKIVGFSKTPEEIIEFEKKQYPENERLPIELLEKNYNKYFISRINEIKQYSKISL